MKNKGFGFIIVIVSAILAVAAMIVYPFVMYTAAITFVPLAIAVILVLLTIVLSMGNKKPFWTEILPVITTCCMAFGATLGVGKMVNEIGYVISGLDPMSAITSFIAFEALTVLGMILSMIGSFMKQTR